MSLGYQGETVASGPQQAASKKAAEQLAAQALLELLSRLVSGPGDGFGQRRRAVALAGSPTRRGSSWNGARKSDGRPPQFEQQANPRGYQVRAVLDGQRRPALLRLVPGALSKPRSRPRRRTC